MTRSWWSARRTSVLWAVALLMVVAACTDDALPVAAPIDVETCDELVDISVQLAEVWVDVLDELPIEQLLSDELPPEFTELADIAADLDDRTARLGCDPEEMNAAVRTELEQRDLEGADGIGVDLLLDIIQGGVVGELPPPPPSTTEASS